jgi:tetratricopeptide (TPR) repeat protein
MGRDDEAIAEIRLAQTLDPLSSIISSSLGFRLYFARRYDQGIEQFRKTLDRDPNFANAHAGLGKVFEQKAMYSEAVGEMKKALSLSEKNTVILAGLAHAYAAAGNPAEANQILGNLEKLSRHRYVSSYEIAVIYLGLGKKDQAFEWLEKAYDERASQLIFLKTDPRLDSLRSDAKFLDLLRRMRLQ